MFVAGIKHQTTGYGKCVPRPLLSPLNYLAELHWGMSLGLRARQTPFEVTQRHTCDCLMWQGGGYVVPL